MHLRLYLADDFAVHDIGAPIGGDIVVVDGFEGVCPFHALLGQCYRVGANALA